MDRRNALKSICALTLTILIPKGVLGLQEDEEVLYTIVREEVIETHHPLPFCYLYRGLAQSTKDPEDKVYFSITTTTDLREDLLLKQQILEKELKPRLRKRFMEKYYGR